MPRHTNKCKAEEDTGGDTAKRHEATLPNNIADEYVCPITTELPLDPVMAQDGQVYERSAIEDLIAMQGDAIRSPITNDPMGPQLLPAIQARNAIEQLVRSGTIDGDKARHWKERLEDEKKVASLRKDAEKGDEEAMCKLGNWFAEGSHGLKEDDAKAYEWYRKAADQQYPPAMCAAGSYLVGGLGGVEKNVTEGMTLVGMAAQAGFPFAALQLGYGYGKGLYGFPRNIDRARYWLKKALGGNMDDVYKTRAQVFLEEALGGNE